jgi:glutathione synthase/RimK-type ligase-like ATP-grasp enzyme
VVNGVEVLILTSELDFASDRVCRHLSKQGTSFLRLNREQLITLALCLDPVQSELTCRNDGKVWHVGTGLKSIWWRQGTFDRNISDQGLAPEDQMVRSQWPAFMRSMMIFAGARWVNHPAAVYRAETKAVQLAVAARLGFRVPATLMTNDCLAPVERRIGNDVALKSIDTFLVRDGSDQLFGYTTLMPWQAVANPELRLAPVTAQQALTDKKDLRVTIIGDHLWAVEVGRGGAPREGDWRLTPKKELSVRTIDLPHAEQQQCKDLLKELGLLYGAIDLIRAGGETWFIEVNPTGEWGWLDGAERPIAGTIAEYLACN